MSNTSNEIAPVATLPHSSAEDDLSPESPYGEKKDAFDVASVRHAPTGPTVKDAHNSVGLALIEQGTTIPQTGERKMASKMEYWLYIVYCGSPASEGQ